MFRFAHPDFLYLLFILPVLFAFFVYAVIRKKRAIKKYGNPQLLSELMPEVSPKRQQLKFWLLFGAIVMVIIVMAGPQFGSKLETVKRQGIEIMVCLDVSNSMQSADTWACIGIVCFILFIGCLILFFFSKYIRLKKLGFYGGVLLLLVVVCTNIFAADQKDDLVNRKYAIIFSPTVTIKSTPDASGTDLFILHDHLERCCCNCFVW